MSKSALTPIKKAGIWIRTAGRCEFPGCNRRLDLDSVLKLPTNVGEHAHIIGDREKGPRGDAYFSERLGKEPSNILLLCEEHHKKVDGPEQLNYSVEQLREFKELHESRVARLLDIDLTCRSHVVAFHSRIGEQSGVFDPIALNRAVILNSDYSVFPERERPIRINGDALPYGDGSVEHWPMMEATIKKALEQQFEGVKGSMVSVEHMSVFAMGPMPDLVALGKAISDKRPADVFQYDRLQKTWCWPSKRYVPPPQYHYELPLQASNAIAIEFCLSAPVDRNAIEDVVGEMPLARFYVDNPSVHIIGMPDDLTRFKLAFRAFLSEICDRFGRPTLNLFPAAPISICVELGRLILPKADPSIVIWDYQRDAKRFVKTLTI